jgi:Ca2+-binding EF-hand superfamily protein
MTAKEGLLLWVRKKTAGYNHVDPPGVRDFSQSWKSGMALCALIHRHRPNLIPYDTLDPKNAAHNLELAFSVAEKDLGIARLLDVADLTAVERPDERSVMTYISEFFHRFASENVKENAARRVAKFLQFAREVEQSQHEYERRARDLIAWANEQHRVFNEQKFGETLEEVQAAQAQFRNYMVKVKPEKVAERLDVEVLFAEIQTNLHVNNRRPYVPDDSVKPDAVGQAFEQLNGAEGAYGRALRDSRFRFIKKREFNLPQEKIDEFTAAFKHFDKDGNQTLDKKEFKAALQGLGIPFKDDAAFDKVFASVANGAPQITLEQYIAYNVSLAQDKDSPDQIIESFKVMANDADTIAADQLHMPPLTQEETQYLQTHMPKADESHFDYKAYVQASFVDN